MTDSLSPAFSFLLRCASVWGSTHHPILEQLGELVGPVFGPLMMWVDEALLNSWVPAMRSDINGTLSNRNMWRPLSNCPSWSPLKIRVKHKKLRLLKILLPKSPHIRILSSGSRQDMWSFMFYIGPSSDGMQPISTWLPNMLEGNSVRSSSLSSCEVISWGILRVGRLSGRVNIYSLQLVLYVLFFGFCLFVASSTSNTRMFHAHSGAQEGSRIDYRV